MARIEPFRGLRPDPVIVKEVASPPYDVLSSQEAKKMIGSNENSFLHIVKPEIDLSPETDLYSDIVYETAKNNFRRFIETGILIQDQKRCFYIYKQVWGDHVQVGLVAGASADDYLDDVIKKHEHTREDKEMDRMRHIEALNANTGPVFLTFKENPSVVELMNRGMEQSPVYDFKSDDGVRHIFYVIEDDSIIKKISEAFNKVDFLYVADGHHRSASATKIKVKREKSNPSHTGNEEYNFFLSVIFPHNQMKILPYNRVVKDMNGMCKAELFHKISGKFTYEETDLSAPETNHTFCMFVSGKWYLLKVKEDSFDVDDPVNSLDAAILQNNILGPVLGIENPRKDNRIDFIGGIRGTEELERLVNNGDFKFAFSMYPTSIEELFRVADSGKTMPPKSTWFEPKLRSGLVTHLLD